MSKRSLLSNLGIMLGLTFVLTNCRCTGLSIGSYVAVYKGKILTTGLPIDTTIEIFRNDRGSSIFVDGKIASYLHPTHPDRSGNFFIWTTSPNYGDLEDPPPQWKSGPIEIFITHPAIMEFRDTLTEEDLKNLPQITPEQAGIKLGKDEKGVWILPDITLQPK